MRTTLISIALLLTFSVTAQKHHFRDGVGIFAGGNFADVVGRGVQGGNTPKTGLRAGVSLESTIIESFYYRMEVLYNSKGTSYSELIPGGNRIDFNFHYAEIPMMGMFEFTNGIAIGGGLYGSYLVAKNISTTVPGSNPQFDLNDLRNVEYGYLVELAFFQSSGIQGGIRFQRSISTINKSIDRYNQVIGAWVGILFNSKP